MPAALVRPVPAARPRRPPPYALDPATLRREVRVDVHRASGPGGQHVNRTESAVRLVHEPSGVVVVASDTRSQARNREIAFARLAARLCELNRVPPRRVKTRVPRAAKARRLEAKRRRAEIKRARGRPTED
ncbi:MAG TPA: peptide chain release factor-like protein [Burkholderiales bacterium]